MNSGPGDFPTSRKSIGAGAWLEPLLGDDSASKPVVECPSEPALFASIDWKGGVSCHRRNSRSS